ncbi:MAG TPA: IS4 family transposase [Gammaproteobacteria bacterium]|nr:IS4 family transposase [Gammaproteobacteria bacterium]HIJ24031.1 IS4 family transposase [Gammaproteobacteria bacterium]HIJ31312.1 IS4 family transposase [Gammaproteobacteria bacterium]HIJ48260.1 IS4 family transposase [Gammaproteobacteria bacterium]
MSNIFKHSLERAASRIRQLAEESGFIARHRTSDTAFTRKRSLPFPVLVKFLMNNLKRALQDELDSFFSVLGSSVSGGLQRVVTKAALSKARRKLKHTAFIELNQETVKIFYSQPEGIKRWNGFRLLSVDGSKLNLPNSAEIAEHFGTSKGSPQPRALLSSLYDPLNQMHVDQQLAPFKSSERELASRHLNATVEGDLILYDRGYPAFWLFAQHRAMDRDFCMRLSRSFYNEARDLYLRPESDKIEECEITLTPNRESHEKCKELGVSAAPITLRLIRVPLDEPTDKESKEEYEILITSLVNQQAYPAELFGPLYHLRWGVEEGYKRLKLRSELESWSGRTVESICQDTHAKALTLNLNTLAVLAAEEEAAERLRCKKERKHVYAVNRAQALSRMKDTVVRLTTLLNPRNLIDELVTSASQLLEPVRPGRSNKRKPRPAAGHRYKHSYKGLR